MQTKKFFFSFLLFLIGLGFFSACSQSFTNLPVNRPDETDYHVDYFQSIPIEEVNSQGHARWHREVFPLQVKIDDDIRESRRERIIFGMEEWNRVVGVDVFIWEVANLERYVFYGQICEPEEGTIFVFETELGNDEEDRVLLGLTTNFYFVNDEHFIRSSFVQFDEELEVSEIQYVALHEFGHVLGLRHDRADISSIMYPHVLSSFGSLTSADVYYIRNQL